MLFLDETQSNQLFIQYSITCDKRARVYSLLFTMFGLVCTHSSLLFLPLNYFTLRKLLFPWIPGVPVNDESIQDFYKPHFSHLISNETTFFENEIILKKLYKHQVPDVLIYKISNYCETFSKSKSTLEC